MIIPAIHAKLENSRREPTRTSALPVALELGHQTTFSALHIPSAMPPQKYNWRPVPLLPILSVAVRKIIIPMEMAIVYLVTREKQGLLAIPKQLLHNVARLPTKAPSGPYARRTPKMPLPVMRFENHL